MFRKIALAATALLCLAMPAHAAEKDCNVHGLGYVTQGGRMVYNFAKLGLAPASDVKAMLTTSSGGATAFADIIDLWRAMGCAAQQGDATAINLRNRWAGGIGETIDGFNASKAYKFYVNVARNLRPHLGSQGLSAAERQLLNETARWGQGTGNPRFAGSPETLAQAIR
ncbi:MAG TPA: hypothetical protein VHP58_00140 [Alphaproteobacteria bacterium]|nr:hypothetical protein [Alphaproteobacteria bacterium]